MKLVRVMLVLPVIALALGAGPAAEQAENKTGGSGGYSALRLDDVGVFVGGFDGRIESMSDGVKITLLSDDPAKPPLPISANQMKFTWPETGGKRPSRILLEGKVHIKHPQAEIHAEKADWDFDKGLLTFTGDPVMKNERVPEGIQAQKIILDFDKGRYQVFGGRAEMIPFGDAGGTAGAAEPSSLLRAEDVRDWTGLFTRLAVAAKAEQASPGKQLVSLLDPKMQKSLESTPPETLAQEKDSALKQINRVLMHPKFYEAAAWQGVEIAAEAQALLKKGGLNAQEQMRLNRLLLEATYPDLIAKLPKGNPEGTTK